MKPIHIAVCIPGSEMPIESVLWGYYVQEALRGTSHRYSMLVDYANGYDLEPGDIVQFTPRWAASAIKCRVIGVTLSIDEPGVALNLEEVL